MGSTVVNEDCTLVSTCVRDGGEPIMNMLTSNHVEVTNYHTVYLFFVVFLWQVRSTVVNEDCTLVSTCVRDGGGAYYEHVDFEPCRSNKLSYVLFTCFCCLLIAGGQYSC